MLHMSQSQIVLVLELCKDILGGKNRAHKSSVYTRLRPVKETFGLLAVGICPPGPNLERQQGGRPGKSQAGIVPQAK